MNMKRKTKIILLVFSSIICGILALIFVVYFSIYSLKQYVTNVMFGRVEEEYLVRNSKVLQNKIGEIEKVEFQFFPVFSFKHEYFIYDVKLTYKVTTKDKKEHMVMVLINQPYYNDEQVYYYDKYLYAFQVDDEIIYEDINLYEKFMENSIVEYAGSDS